MKRGKNTSVKWKMVGMILLYWALPFVLMLALVGHIMADRQEKTGLERMAAQLEMDNQNSIERIDSAISDSRQATYDKTLYSYYDEFRKGSVNFDTVYNKGQYYMAKQYGKRKEISSSVFMLLRAPKVYKMTSYNTPAGGSYNQLKTFWEKDCDDVLEFAKDLETSIGIYQADGRLYLVRNLVDSATYRPWGVLVHRLNLNYCFESLLHFYDNANVKIVLDGKNIVTQGNAEIWKDAPEAEKKGSAVYTVKDKIMVDSFSLPVGELFTTANYKMAFERLGIATAYRNSMIISGTVALAVILLAGMASFATVAIFSFLWSYNDLFTQMFFLRNKKFWAITRLMQMLTSKEGTNYGLMASTVSLVVIPVIIVYIFLQKYIIKGMTAGAVKG